VENNQVEAGFKLSTQLARASRVEILKMTHRAGASHVGSALSVVDILAVLYESVAKISPASVNSSDRDCVILSKGHACTALYSVLALKGFFPLNWLERYCADGSELSGHVTSAYTPGVELSTGSLGHGLPYGLGIQMSRKRSGISGRTFVIMSDGECDEGTTWESALIASHHEIDSLVVIIDRNGIQSMGSTEETLALEPFQSKWESFGWEVRTLDGHDHDSIFSALSLPSTGKPICIIANTVKGKGVDYMENQVLWHYRPPNENDLENALTQIMKEQK
jgi:transketolase